MRENNFFDNENTLDADIIEEVAATILEIYKDDPAEIERESPAKDDSLRWRCWKCKQQWYQAQRCMNCKTSINDYNGDTIDIIVFDDTAVESHERDNVSMRQDTNAPSKSPLLGFVFKEDEEVSEQTSVEMTEAMLLSLV